jgi:hypothetical protein
VPRPIRSIPATNPANVPAVPTATAPAAATSAPPTTTRTGADPVGQRAGGEPHRGVDDHQSGERRTQCRVRDAVPVLEGGEQGREEIAQEFARNRRREVGRSASSRAMRTSAGVDPASVRAAVTVGGRRPAGN